MRLLDTNPILMALAAENTRREMLRRLWENDAAREEVLRAQARDRKRKQRALDAVLGRRSDGRTIRPIVGR